MKLEKYGLKIQRIAYLYNDNNDSIIGLEIIAMDEKQRSFITRMELTKEFLDSVDLDVIYSHYLSAVWSEYENLTKEKIINPI